MRAIKIEANANGSHENMVFDHPIHMPPGWALIPDDVEIPNSFPFVDVEIQDGLVVRLAVREIEVPDEQPKTPSRLDEIEAQVMYTAMETGTLLEVD